MKNAGAASGGRRTGSDGFTLVEVVITMVLMLITISASLSLMSWIHQATGFSGRLSAACALAQEQLEELINQGYDDAVGGSDTVGLYSRSWTVTENTDIGSSMSGNRIVAVTVSWPTPRGDTREMRVQSVISPDRMTSNLGLATAVASAGGGGASPADPDIGGSDPDDGEEDDSPGNSGSAPGQTKDKTK